MDTYNHHRNQTCSAAFGSCMAVLVVFLGGCSPPQRDQVVAATLNSDDATMTANDFENQPSPRQSSAQRLKELIEQSRNDLAQRLNVDAADITVVEARHVVWPDGSAGCPMPGYEYLQVLTEGVLIQLDAGNRTFQYHSAKGGAAFLCEKPAAVNPPSRYEEQ